MLYTQHDHKTYTTEDPSLGCSRCQPARLHVYIAQAGNGKEVKKKKKQ